MVHPDTIPSSGSTSADPTSYSLVTIQDIFDLHAKLPPERGAVMLKEVLDGIKQAALIAQLAGAELKTDPLVWTDDDERRTNMSFATEGGSPIFSFEVRPSDSENAPECAK